MQQIQIDGYLGKDAVVKEVNGNSLLIFNVCVTESYKNAKDEKVENSTWYSCISKNKALAAYLKKGDRVFVQVELKAKIYTDDNKKSFIDLTVNVNRIELGSNKKKDNQN